LKALQFRKYGVIWLVFLLLAICCNQDWNL
jgi:hypothetical protein